MGCSDEGFNSGAVLTDLQEDEEIYQTADNVIILGWAHNLNGNGNSREDWFYAVCSDTADGVD
ncbi:MAG: hypothetical protein M8352_10545, partial [ANME-2 cluster archaeon]|nr:hypothetical protein [ANME-2 cluster archaeon]